MSHLFTADLHFGHNFVAGLRGFDSAEDHDEFMIGDINSVTNEDDILWILGDIGIRIDEETLDKVGRLNGRKMLISGNHDATHPMHKNAWKSQAKALRVFEYVAPFQRLRLGGEDILLSHLPYFGDHITREKQDEVLETESSEGRTEYMVNHIIPDRYEQYRLRDEGLPLLCGHVHSAWHRYKHQWNVGVDFGPPVKDEVVIRWAKMMRKMKEWERLTPEEWKENR